MKKAISMNSKQRTLESFTKIGNDLEKENHFIYFGDIFSSLHRFDDNSIDVSITSPPYWNQRDYGFTGQIGNEPTQEEYIIKLTNAFSILRDKLAFKGVFFLNIGDKYLSKYGNTPLGMIPYKIACSLIEDGWYLQDTIIWYKPNHMPSSVKNRFTNTYEPVFVFVKNQENYYSQFFHSDNYSNFINVPLQQNMYRHIATFPVNLITNLISKLQIPPDAKILDPFAGSGTTTFAVQELNERFKKKYSSLAIEAKFEFVQIIKTRCNLVTKSILKVNFNPVRIEKDQTEKANGKFLIDKKYFNNDKIDFSTPSLIIKTIESLDYQELLVTLTNESFCSSLADYGLLIIILPVLDPHLLVSISKSPNWIIRNVLLRYEGNLCYPILVMVKDIKSIHYRFNLDAIREEHFNKDDVDWKTKDFIGTKVLKNNSIFKSQSEGKISDIISFNENFFPAFVQITWEDGSNSIQESLNFINTNKYIFFCCPVCKNTLTNYFQNRVEISCPNCSKLLWDNYESIPILTIKSDNKPPEKKGKIMVQQNKLKEISHYEKSYKGKFTLEDKINRGQSPGARLSVTEQFFFVTRYFSIEHGLFAKYLNLLLKHLNISKQAVIDKFPPNYKHTIGHWFRYDMGGSLPKIEDIELLEEILEFKLEPNYKTLVTKTGIKLQSVLKDKQGKNPGDFILLPSREIQIFFTKLVK